MTKTDTPWSILYITALTSTREQTRWVLGIHSGPVGQLLRHLGTSDVGLGGSTGDPPRIQHSEPSTALLKYWIYVYYYWYPYHVLVFYFSFNYCLNVLVHCLSWLIFYLLLIITLWIIWMYSYILFWYIMFVMCKCIHCTLLLCSHEGRQEQATLIYSQENSELHLSGT